MKMSFLLMCEIKFEIFLFVFKFRQFNHIKSPNSALNKKKERNINCRYRQNKIAIKSNTHI